MTDPQKNLSGFQRRLKALIGDQSLKAFGDSVGINYQNLQRYLDEDKPGEPRMSAVVAICTSLSVNANWLLTGEGGATYRIRDKWPVWHGN